MGNPVENAQHATQFDINHYYYLPRPQTIFGGDSGTPPPPTTDFEVAEQTTGVFDKLIHDDVAPPNGVVVTKS